MLKYNVNSSQITAANTLHSTPRGPLPSALSPRYKTPMSTTNDKYKGTLSDHAGADALASASASKVSYETSSERLKLSDDPDIPTSATLIGLGYELDVLRVVALARSQHAEKALQILQGKMEVRRSSSLEAEQEKGCLAVEDAEPRERIGAKKRKAEPNHARLVAVGARHAIVQGPASGGCYP